MLALLANLGADGARAQSITIDGRLSPARTLAGPSYTIDATLGRQVGSNLFHSFGKFGLATGETATFTPNGATSPVGNVIGRVTGGAPSSIDGKIQSNIAGANVYLINPNGIVFGPNAAINVSGAFRASTADYVRMSDGGRFQATNPDASTLTAAPPAAFGFLTAAPARLTVNGSTLTGAPGQTLGLVGGPVSIDRAVLSTPAGKIRLTSALGPGEVPIAPGSAPSVGSYGPIDVNQSLVNISGQSSVGGGKIRLRGGAVALTASEINADNVGTNAGGSIAIRSDGPLSLTRGLKMHADALGDGAGGNISLRAATLTLNEATVHADTQRSGKAGDIDVAITGAAALDGSAGSVPASISSTSLDGSSGAPGNITIASGALSLGGGATISSRSLGASNTGAVRVDTGNLTMSGTSQISSDTVGSGAAGSVSVNTGSLFMTDQLTQISSSTTAGGPAGRVSVTADSATISNVAQISALTTGAGNGGTVQVAVAGELKILGPSQDNIFITGIGSVADPGSTGRGGSVFVTTGRLSISGFSAEISSSTLGAGRAGDVTVQVAGPLSITGPVGQFPTGIVAATLQPSFADIPRVTGDAGNVSVSAQSISLTGGGSIATLTSGVGAGGSVGVSTPGNLLLDSGAQIAASATDPNSASAGQVTVLAGRLAIGGGAQIASTTAGKGIGGDVSVASPLIDLVGPGPQITARSTGSGDAGSIRLAALRLNLRGGASISTEAATANGGNISLTVVDFLYLKNSQITTSVKGSTGNGGNIAIDPKLLVLDHSQIIAQAVQGRGGNITIVADQFVPSADSLVSASSQLGISGTVELIGPRVDLNGSLVVLSSELYNAAAVLRDNCAARGSRPRSSLVERGRGGLPQDTEAAVPALYLIGRDVPHRQGSATPEALLPAVQTALRLRADCGG